MIKKSNTSDVLKTLHDHLTLLEGDQEKVNLGSLRLVKFNASDPTIDYTSVALYKIGTEPCLLDINVVNGKLHETTFHKSIIDNISSFLIEVQHELLNYNAKQ